MDENLVEDEDQLKKLIGDIRSSNESERRSAINHIPNIILKYLKEKDNILDQCLLLIYNLNTNSENYEMINSKNRVQIITQLLRLYVDTIPEYGRSQIEALRQIVDYAQSSKFLMELAYILHKCNSILSDEQEKEIVEKALNAIQDKASLNLYTDTLLMVHSIKAIK